MTAAPVGLQLVGTMQSHVEDYFDHPKLQQIMQYTLVFLGGAPRTTPALYNLMSHVDFNLGVYYPDGGVGAVVDGLVELGEELGVTYETDAEVNEISRRKDGFLVETVHGDTTHPDEVVVHADYGHTEQELLPRRSASTTPTTGTPERTPPRRSCSTSASRATWSTAAPHARPADRLGPPLRRHLRRARVARRPGVLPLCALEDRRHRRPRRPLEPVRLSPHRAGAARRRRDPRGVPRAGARRHR